MNSHYDNTPASSDIHLCPPSADGQDIFRRTCTFDSNFSTTNYHGPSVIKYPRNPRKKGTKMICLEDTHPISNLKYAKKPDPSAPKITRPCSECGKKFWSWKALFGHMRCHPERQWRGINPPPNFKKPDHGGSDSSCGDDLAARMTDEDHHVATCLLMLANANGPVSPCDTTPTVTNNVDSADSVMGYWDVGDGISRFGDYEGSGGSNCRFECSSCKKVFGSHQALGGHKASHKSVKGCFAITKTEGEDDVLLHLEEAAVGGDQERYINGQGRVDVVNNTVATLLMPLSTHQCSICLRVFSSGQALGGHMTCHWEKLGNDHVNDGGTQGLNIGSFTLTACGLDLNMQAPAPASIDNASSSGSYSSNLALDLRLGV